MLILRFVIHSARVKAKNVLSVLFIVIGVINNKVKNELKELFSL